MSTETKTAVLAFTDCERPASVRAVGPNPYMDTAKVLKERFLAGNEKALHAPMTGADAEAIEKDFKRIKNLLSRAASELGGFSIQSKLTVAEDGKSAELTIYGTARRGRKIGEKAESTEKK